MPSSPARRSSVVVAAPALAADPVTETEGCSVAGSAELFSELGVSSPAASGCAGEDTSVEAVGVSGVLAAGGVVGVPDVGDGTDGVDTSVGGSGGVGNDELCWLALHPIKTRAEQPIKNAVVRVASWNVVIVVRRETSGARFYPFTW